MSGLDPEYSALMRELWGSPSRWNVRRSYVGVARRLGVDEETVRNRLKRLKDSGLLVGWRMVPNPSLFGRSSVMQYLSFAGQAEKERGILRLTQMDGVIVVASLFGSDLLITIYDDEERSASRRLSELALAASPSEWTGMGLPPTQFRMTPTDWQIVGLMLRDAERSVSEVAAEAKVSTRTVKRRLDRMMAASAIFIAPIIDQAKSAGVAYQVIVESYDGRKSDVDRVVTSRIPNLIFKGSDSSNTLVYGFTGRNVTEGKDLQKWVEDHSNVKSVRTNIVERVVYAFDWLEKEAKRLSRAN